MKRLSSTLRFTAAVAAALLATAPAALAQSWEILLPDPLYTEASSPVADGGGRSLTFQSGAPQRVYVGSVNYDITEPTITRFVPDAPEFPLYPTSEGVDSEALDGLVVVTEMLEIPGHGLWAVGRYRTQTAQGTAYYWKVRYSPTGNFNDWSTVETWNLPIARKSRTPGEANACGITFSKNTAGLPDYVYVSGCATDGSGWRWIVRRKKLGTTDGFEEVLNVPMNSYAYRTRVCFYPGNGTFPPAVLTSGKTPLLGSGKSATAKWAIRRSLDGGATFTEEHRWTPATRNYEATPADIVYDPSTGYIYAVGGLDGGASGGSLLPQGGWVVRVNRHGGHPEKWETLLETTSQPGRAQRIAFGNGRVFVSGLFLPTSTSSTGVAAVISSASVPLNPDLTAWASSWSSSFGTPTYPFGHLSSSRACIIAYEPDSEQLYATGEVIDYTEGDLFHGTWMSLSRLPLVP